MYSVSVLGSVRTVSVRFNAPPPARVRLLAHTPVCEPVPRWILANIPVLTGTFEEHQVILATSVGSGDLDAWSFEVGVEDLAFVQEQTNLPACILCAGEEAVYLQRARDRDEDAVAARIRGVRSDH